MAIVFVEKVTGWFDDLLRTGGEQLHPDQRALIKHCCALVAKISANPAVGKEGRFQAFILLTVRYQPKSPIYLLNLFPSHCLFQRPRSVGSVTVDGLDSGDRQSVRRAVVSSHAQVPDVLDAAAEFAQRVSLRLGAVARPRNGLQLSAACSCSLSEDRFQMNQ